MKYQFCCDDCSIEKSQIPYLKKEDRCDSEELIAGAHPKTGEYLFFINCKMQDKPGNPKCPKCGGTKTYTSFTENNIMCYIRGDGLVKDKGGARRDMHKHHLQNNDPYGYMRQPGEVDHMIDRLERAGQDLGKVRAKNAITSQKAKREADAMVEVGLTEDQHKILSYLENNEPCSVSELSKIHDDINKVLTEMNYEYVCQNTNKDFILMALGRRVLEKFTELSSD